MKQKKFSAVHDDKDIGACLSGILKKGKHLVIPKRLY